MEHICEYIWSYLFLAVVYLKKSTSFCDLLFFFHSWSFNIRLFFVAVNINGRTEAEEGETVILEGTVEFCPSIQYIKWQMWHNAKFIDVNMHKSKYYGTKNCLWNPKLVLNDVDQQDIGAYRIKVKSTTIEEYSNVHRIKILARNGKSFHIIFISLQ